MNINKLNHHMLYNKIIDVNKDENGKINWNNILDYPNLPTEFIDCYFHQLKPFGIERRIKINDVLIKKYGSLLNWYQLLTYQDISEELLNHYSNKFISINLWIYVLKYQKISYNFLIKHKNIFKEKQRRDIFLTALLHNMHVDKNTKNNFLQYLISLGWNE